MSITNADGRVQMRTVLVAMLEGIDAGTISPVLMELIECEPDGIAGPDEPAVRRRQRVRLTLEETYVPVTAAPAPSTSGTSAPAHQPGTPPRQP